MGAKTISGIDRKISELYEPFPKQREFHNCRAKYRLFGGAAGPGKTKALLWEAIGQANRYAGVDTVLLRRTFPELESSLLNYFRRDVPRELYRSYNESKHVVTWHNGSTTALSPSTNRCGSAGKSLPRSRARTSRVSRTATSSPAT